MTDSVSVLQTLKVAYTIYAFSIIALFVWFAYRVTSEGKSKIIKASTFYTYIGILVTVGVGIHILTFNKIPWISMDFERNHIKADKTFNITVQDHKFQLPEEKLLIDCGDRVLFNVDSTDLTYGFGLFRQNNSMVMQMQVVPGSKNDILWQFNKNGIYNIRSTEYSGPKGINMVIDNAVQVVGCSEDDKYSMVQGGKE